MQIDMKQFSHKIMALVMAFVVLFSTMSFTVNMHYCGDTLVETAIFHKAKGWNGNGKAFNRRMFYYQEKLL